MINGTNMLGKYNPRWPVGNEPETIRVPDPRMPPPLTAIGIAGPGGAIRRAAGLLAAWLTGLRRRAGRRLFAMNDLEARWRGWQVIELRGGLGRQYRDPRFDGLREGGRPQTGIPVLPRPAVPEAWDDHWDGRSLASGKDRPGCPLDGDG